MVWKVFFMDGLLMWSDGEFRWEELRVLGVRFPAVLLPRRRNLWLQRMDAGRAARFFRRIGVRCVIFPRDYTQKEYFLSKGFQTVNLQPLRLRKAAEWALSERKKRGLSGGAAVYGERVTPELAAAVRTLNQSVRSITLSPMRGGEELAEELLLETGSALRIAETGELCRAELTLLFSAPETIVPWGLCLPLYKDCPPSPHFVLAEEKQKQLPPGSDPDALIASLYRSGALRISEIYIETLKLG